MNQKIVRIGGSLLLALCMASAGAAEPPVIGKIAMDPSDTSLTTETVTFTIPASSPAVPPLPLTYTWDFGDGSPVATGASVTHVFPVDGNYVVSVDVSDGVNTPVTDIAILSIIQPPAPTDPVGVDEGKSEVNPDNNLRVSVTVAKGGFVELLIDDSQLTASRDVASRAGVAYQTTWGSLASRAATSARPRIEMKQEGIVVATARVLDAATQAEIAKVRKPLVISAEEVGAPPRVKSAPPVAQRGIKVDKIKGKFNFSDASKSDAVNVTFNFELPEGVDVTAPHQLSLCIGNIDESVSLDNKGKGEGSVRYKKVRIKYPKLPKGQTLTPAGSRASVTVQMAASDLDDAGFDTHGITPRIKTGNPRVQVAVLLEGVGYSDQAEVEFKVSSKGDTGSFKLPSRRP